MGVFVKAAAWAADRTTSRRILVPLPPFILEEPLMASGWAQTHAAKALTHAGFLRMMRTSRGSYPDCWVDEEGLLTFCKLLHPLHQSAESECAAWYGLIPIETHRNEKNITNLPTISWCNINVKSIKSPGLMCGIEANQYRSVDLRVLQAEVQLTCHKWSLRGQRSNTHKVVHFICQVYKLLTHK